MTNVFIIDDEKIARKNLSLILDEYCPEVFIVGEANSVDSAIDLLPTLDVDVIFLDINMPHKDGFSFLKHFTPRDFEVIFVTAYQEYTLEAIKESAFDYILKPVEPEELVRSLKKLKVKKDKQKTGIDAMDLENLISKLIKQDKGKEIIVPLPFGYKIIKEQNIVLIEGNNNTTKVHLFSGQLLDSTNKIKDFERDLGNNSFFRLHKSYLLNLEHVKEYTSKGANYVITSNNIKVDVSRKKIVEFHEAINHYLKNK